jgi:hypothetical protein
VIGARTSLLVAMDGTDFDADNHATIILSLITEHGRATPLVWLTVNKNALKDRRSLYQRRVLVRLAELLPANLTVGIIAVRGFGDQNLYRLLTEELPFDYVIRFRGTIKVTAVTGVTPHRRGLGEPQRAGARTARGHGHGGSLSSRYRGLCVRP